MGEEKPPLRPLSAEEFSRLTSQERIEYLVRAIEDTERRLKALGCIETKEIAIRSS
jgi:hypothetical protein